jgi:hypothetical protein
MFDDFWERRGAPLKPERKRSMPSMVCSWRRLARWACAFAAVGAGVPLLYLVLFFAGGTRLSDWDPWVWMWPTSLLLLATAGHEHSAGSAVVILVAILMNAIFYATVGTALAYFWARGRHALSRRIRE